MLSLAVITIVSLDSSTITKVVYFAMLVEHSSSSLTIFWLISELR